jgi:hydrogenase/urease accessory protein HupE
MKYNFLSLIVFYTLIHSQAGMTHALDPGFLELSLIDNNHWRVLWRTPDVNGKPMPINVQLPPGCSQEPSPSSFDGRAWTSIWITMCKDGITGKTIAIQNLEHTNTDTLVRIEAHKGDIHTQRLTASQPFLTIPEKNNKIDTFMDYTSLGVIHILEGIDHLLFVFALLLLTRRSRLLGAITCFTIGHSITLVLSTLNIIYIPSPPIEAIIALSIVYLAFELSSQKPTLPRATNHVYFIPFGFGLFHGLGFAGALQEIGLPKDDIALALFAFNIGVEIGQLLFISAIIIAGILIYKMAPRIHNIYAKYVMTIAYLIGGLSAFWVIQRISTF